MRERQSGSIRPHVLILGGSAEARALAASLAGLGLWRITTSLAGRTASPAPVAGERRIGGFGGAVGLLRFLQEEAVGALIDATHPFAVQISDHAFAAARAAERPLLRLERPAWQPTSADRWSYFDDWQEAVRQLSDAARAFLSIGASELAAFAAHPSAWFLVRTVDLPASPIPLPRHELILGRGPFELESEIALLCRYSITHLVAKNSGGKAVFPKLEAARKLALPVLLKNRPGLPPVKTVSTVDEASAWLHDALADRE